MLDCPQIVDLDTTWWGTWATTLHESPITDSITYKYALSAAEELTLAGRTLYTVAHVYEPTGSPINVPQQHVCLSRSRIDVTPPTVSSALLNLQCTGCSRTETVQGVERHYNHNTGDLTLRVPGYADIESNIWFHTIKVYSLWQADGVTPPSDLLASNVNDGGTCQASINSLKLADGSSVTQSTMSELNDVIDLASGGTIWMASGTQSVPIDGGQAASTRNGGPCPAPLSHRQCVPESSQNGWFGKTFFNRIVPFAQQLEQPGYSCLAEDANRTYEAVFVLTALQRACFKFTLRWLARHVWVWRVFVNDNLVSHGSESNPRGHIPA